MVTLGNPIITLSSFFCLSLLLLLLRFLHKVWWTPIRIQYLLRSQGIKGPSYKFIHGNTKEIMKMRKEASSKPMALSHDILPKVQPQVYLWISKYGRNYLYWYGTQPQLLITEPELIKEVLNNRDKACPKEGLPFYVKKIMGNGLVASEGETWSKHRKLLNHAFKGESLRNMIPAIIVSVQSMLETWKHQQGKEIEVFEEFRLLTSEVISRTAFGSSYLEGKTIFDLLIKYSMISSRNALKVGFPGIISKLWKTDDEIEADKHLREMHGLVMQIIKRREEKVKNGDLDSFGTDFLGLLLNAHHDADEDKRVLLEDLIDECKTFYIAGQETSTSSLAWTVLLLAIHTDWQEKARAEVIQLFGDQTPNPDGLSKLDTITMIINEALRLYPPAFGFIRKCEREVRLGKLILPANLNLFITTLAVHHDPEIWGDDAHLFKPDRFSEGVAKATNNNMAAYFPFGIGPRTCVGFNFATVEAKITLAMILQHFSFTLSPAYVHSPALRFTLFPQHGVQVILYSLQS